MTRSMYGLWALTIIALALSARPALAADPPQAPPIRTVTLRVTAAPEPRFALQYLFETPYLEQERGNAAFLYQTAIGQMMQTNSGDSALDGSTLRQWYNDPVEDLPLEKVRPAIARFDQSFRTLEAATLREHCTWEYPKRKEGFPFVNPLLNEYRMLSRLVVVRAKLEIHDADFDTAFKTLRSGIRMGRDLGAGSSFIQHLVGLGMTAGTLRQIEGWIEKPDSPNLYWALTALPDPLVDLRNAALMESVALCAELPELQTLEETVLSNEQVLDLWKRTALWTGYEEGHPGDWLSKGMDLASVMKQYPVAKANLEAEGYAAANVTASPALYVILLDQYHQFQAIRDMTFKWTYVPYSQGHEGLKQSELVASGLWKYGPPSTLGNPFVNSLPAMYRIAFLDARLARDTAMLRCVEAIRMYAAEHDGKLPGALAEIAAVPVPADPLNGQPFQYQRTAGKAILVSPVPPGGDPREGLRYEIELR